MNMVERQVGPASIVNFPVPPMNGSLHRSRDEDEELFNSASEAWFWFIAAQKAKNDGARFVAGQSLIRRPCEPVDILKTLDRLYRARRIDMHHCRVLRHYGFRFMPPDAKRPREATAAALWAEAMSLLEEALIAKGIVHPMGWLRIAESALPAPTHEGGNA